MAPPACRATLSGTAADTDNLLDFGRWRFKVVGDRPFRAVATRSILDCFNDLAPYGVNPMAGCYHPITVLLPARVCQATLGRQFPKTGGVWMTNLYKHIGEKIRELRKTYPKGELSQEDVAEKIGAAANTVSRWETGTYKPTPEDLDALARLFEVSITVFFPDLKQDESRISALASATGGLDKSDFDELIRYAEFRKARRALAGAKRSRSKR
jgi:transcriptional regulator with XRE-family HTH domain